MLFNSLQFLIFFPIVVLLYFVFPKKVRYIWLLIASYYFYMCWNAKYALLMLFSTIVTWLSGLVLEKIKKADYEERWRERLKKSCVAVSFILNLSVLFFFKYVNFAVENLNWMLEQVHVELNLSAVDIILPVGISFYTFQALSYTVDVYRDEIYAEKNILRYALFVSFFPQLVAGPIERSKNLLKQLAVPSRFDFDRAKEGILLMIWGYFLKVVLSDRIAIFVDTVYNGFEMYRGGYIIVATILFAVQIYCDFGGYSCIAMGAAKILGINLMENFNAPYLSRSVAEFWRRWHISLSTWFRDYLYIPLGGNRKGSVRKYINLMIVFLASGLWHGAQWTYVIWGGLNGIYQVIGSLLKPVRTSLIKVFHLNRESLGHKLLQTFTTFCFIDFSWIFFRAQSLSEALAMIKSMFTVWNPWIFFDESLFECGLDRKNFYVMLLSILLLLIADICKYKGLKIRKIILEQDWWFRWMIYIVSVILILVVGVWGSGYDQAGFIYFQF